MELRKIETIGQSFNTNDPAVEGKVVNSAEGKVVNSMLDCLTIDHALFAEPLMRMTQAASALAASPADIRLRNEAIGAWTMLKSDLWQHLWRENALLFSWAKPQADLPEHLFAAQSRDQRHIRELVRKIGEQRFLKTGEWDTKPATSALTQLANLLEEHIERDQEALFPAIRQASTHL
jgi:iron-sulfur cluster repair protein YtfE (RIC family)